MQLILASASPRRKALLSLFGIPFTVRAADIDETMDPEKPPFDEVARVSRSKALAVSRGEEDIVIAADTIVVCQGRVLGKPRSEAEAAQMLARLSSREHTVYTGVAVKRGEKLLVEHEATQVRFRPLTEREIDLYIQTGEPMDKAGSYGIQGYGALLVEGIRGDYFNVVGLPICRLGRMLAQVGEDALAQCAQKCAEKER